MGFEPLEQEQTGFVPLEQADDAPSLTDRIYKTANKFFAQPSVMDDFTQNTGASPQDTAIAENVLAKALMDENAKRKGSIGNSDVKMVDGASGILEVGARKGYAGIGRTEAGAIKLLADILGSDSLSQVSTDQQAYADKVEGGAQLRERKDLAFAPGAAMQDIDKYAAGALGSVIQTAPNMALAAVAPAAVIPSMMATSASEKYGADRTQGMTPLASLINAVPHGVIEGATEKIGMSGITKGVKSAIDGNGVAELARGMVKSSASEVPSEMLATGGQDLNDKIPGTGARQDLTLAQALQNQKDTIIQTLLQSGGMAAGGHALSRMAGDKPAEQAAEQKPEPVNYDQILDTLKKTQVPEQGFQPLQEENQVSAEASNPKEVTPMAQPQEVAATTPPPAQAAPPIQAPRPTSAPKATTLIERIKQLDGVNLKYAPDITGEQGGLKTGYSGLFKPDGRGLDELATMLAAEGFPIDLNDANDNGGVNQLAELLRDPETAKTVKTYAAQEEERAITEQKAHAEQLRARMKELGGNPIGKTFADVEKFVTVAEEDHRIKTEKIESWMFQAYSELANDLYAEFGDTHTNTMIEATGSNDAATSYGKLLDAARKARNERTTESIQPISSTASQAGQDDTRTAGQGVGTGITAVRDQGNEELHLTSESQAKPSVTPEQQAEADNQALLKRQVETDAVRNAGLQAQTQPKEEGATSQAGMFTADGRATVAADKQSEAITDLGEKIGAARKDTAVSRGGRVTKESTDTAENDATWRKRFEAVQINEQVDQPWHILDRKVRRFVRGDSMRNLEFSSKEAAEKMIPLAAVALKHRVSLTSRGDETPVYEIKRDVTDRKRITVVPEKFASREDAMKYMAEHAVEIIETKTSFGEEILPKPETVNRIGAVRRSGDVVGKDFMDTFGFRGVEFGNWNNQEERQDVLNHAYDGLLDLAEVLNIPPKAISLNGDLALAFGARGQGLSGARAHYERNRAVINLTKMSGAGALAHEWLHSLDHYLGRLDGKAKGEMVAGEDGTKTFGETSITDYASHGFSYNTKMRAELQAAYKELIETMFYKAEKYVEDTQKAEDWLGRARDSLRAELKKTRDYLARQLDPTYWKRNNKPASAEQLAKFDELADRLIEGQDLSVRPYFDEKKRVAGRLNNSMRMSNETLESLNAIIKDVRGRNGFNAAREGLLDGMRHPMSNYQQRITMLEEARNATEKTKRIPTDYRKDATEIDQGRASDYWATEHEMAARAFSSYVEDKLAEKGNSSDFLSYGSKGRVPTAFGWVRPFPAGEERVAINKAFDKFFEAVQTKETDKGVAMFSQSSKKNATPQTVESITKATARLRNGWSGFRKVSIVQSVKEVPNDVYLRALRALQPINQTTEGIYDPSTNTVYLIAENITSTDRAVWVAAHEVVGHGGIRMLDKTVAEHVSRLSGNGTVKKLAEAIAKDRDEKFDSNIHVQEAIAELAAAHITGKADEIFTRYGVEVPASMQSGIMGVIARIIEAVRNFMSKALGGKEVSDSEVTSLIHQMKDAVEGVERDEQQGDSYALASTAWIKETARSSDFLMRAVKALIDSDSDVLKFPHSKAATIQGALEDMFGAYADMDSPSTDKPNKAEWGGKELKFYGTVTHGDGTKVHTFSTPMNESFSVTEHLNGQIHINVSHLLNGGFGQAVYIGVADYAKNSSEATGKSKVFVADSAGLTDDSLIRRTTNMLSVVARHGTAKYIMPGVEQMMGDKKLGVPALKWGGTDVDKFNALAQTFVTTIQNNVPDIKDVYYDYENSGFYDRTTNERFSKDAFKDYARTTREVGNRARAGESSIRRAVFLQSLMDSESKSVGERESILGELSSNRISADERAVKGLFSKAPKEQIAKPHDFDIARRILPKSVPLLYSRDELGNIRSDFLGSRRLKDFLNAAFIRPMAVKTGLASASPELAKLLRKQKADIDKSLRIASEVADQTKGMTEEESALISRIVTQEMRSDDVPPEHAMRIASVVEQAMTQQGQDAVDLQMLSQEAYEKWKGRYLPRLYMRHLDPEVKGIWRRTFKSSPVEGFKSGSLKGRGKRQVVPVSELQQWQSLGWEVADKNWKQQASLDKSIPDTDTVVIWKDYTPEERKDMGEIEDFRLRFVMGYLAMQRDLAVGRLYKTIAENTEWTRRTPSEGYSYIPETEIPDTGGLKRYGMLSGMYVKDDILSHISQFEQNDNEFQKFYKAALSKWKEGKTVLNPVTHMNNFVSNVTMAHFAGVSYWDGEKYFGALKDLVSTSPMVKEAEDAGLFTGDFSHTEIMKSMPHEVRNLVNHATDSGAVKTGRLIWKIGSLGLNDKMATAYHWGDIIFKYTIYRDARSKGMSPEDAVYHAGKYIFNYDDLPSTARGIRDYALPFFAYTYKVIPALAHTAIEYPWRFAAPATIIASLNALVYAGLAADGEDDDWWLTAITSGTMNALLNAYTLGLWGDDESKTAGQELEQEERKNLAEWDKGASALGTQKTIRLGTDEKTGLPVFLNVYRFMPGGDIQDVQNEKGGIGVPAPFMPSNPLLTTYSALIDNRSWDGREMFDVNDTGTDKAKKTADFLYKQVFPTIALGGTHYDRIMQGVANYSDTTIENANPLKDYTGVGKDGLPSQPKYAAMQTIGIKARPVDLDKSADMNQVGENAKFKSIKIEIRSAARLLDKGAISQREYDRIVSEGEAKMEALSAEE